jgi:bacterioferritin-associated ferredoxin
VYICLCNAITERQVRECAQGGTHSVEELASTLGIGTCCGRCRDCAAQVLAEARNENALPA